MKIVHDIILCCLTFQTVATIEQKVFKNVCTLVCKNNSTSDAQCNSTIILQAVPSIRSVPYTHTISVAWISQRLYLSLEVQQRQAPSEDAQRYHITGQRYLQYGTMYIQYREASREYWLRCGVQLSDRNETTLHPTTSWGGVKASWGYMVITTPHHTTHTHTHARTCTRTRTHTCHLPIQKVTFVYSLLQTHKPARGTMYITCVYIQSILHRTPTGVSIALRVNVLSDVTKLRARRIYNVATVLETWKQKNAFNPWLPMIPYKALHAMEKKSTRKELPSDMQHCHHGRSWESVSSAVY